MLAAVGGEAEAWVEMPEAQVRLMQSVANEPIE